jgi:hypothetical protein
LDLGVCAGHDREPDVAGPELRDQAGAAAGGIGSHGDLATDRTRVVAAAVAGGDPGWQLVDGGIEHGELIGDRVGRGAARSQQTGEGFAGGIDEAEHRREPEAVLVVRGGALLVLGVDVDQRRIQIQHHRGLAGGHRRPTPHLATRLGHGLPQASQPRRVERTDGPTQRRVRRHHPEQHRLHTEPLDVRARFAAAANINIACTNTLPRSCIGSRPPGSAIRADNKSPTPNRSANAPKACNPT